MISIVQSTLIGICVMGAVVLIAGGIVWLVNEGTKMIWLVVGVAAVLSSSWFLGELWRGLI